MSRVGKVPVKILQGVKVNIAGDLVQVEGPRGKLSHSIPKGVTLKMEDGSLIVGCDLSAAKNASALHGLTRTLLHNMVQGAHSGFTRELDIIGVGYRASVKGSTLSMTLGYSHPVNYELPAGVTVKVENNTHVVLNGPDKMLVGMVAAKIRGFREPEPYQGKGIKYKEEHIIRKQGKAAGAK
jgi:large subunit ribosomal protein L6